MLPEIDDQLVATASLVEQSRDHIVRMRGVVEDARRQAELAMSLIEETRSHLARIHGGGPMPADQAQGGFEFTAEPVRY